MTVRKISPLTGKMNAREIDLTEDQMNKVLDRTEPIQNVAPHLSADDREFLITGMTPEDWKQI